MTDVEFMRQHRAEVLAASQIDMQEWWNKAAGAWLDHLLDRPLPARYYRSVSGEKSAEKNLT